MAERNIALVNALCEQPERNIVEFKQANCEPKTIAKLCSALANAARVAQQEFAYVLWGIEDASRQVVGTKFDPDVQKNRQSSFSVLVS